MFSKTTMSNLTIVDNLLSSDVINLPNSEKMEFIFGSIADNGVLNKITDEYDYIFHLACYHGNQSSINNPFADHKNNTITSLKLFDHIKSFKRLDKIVYAGAGCSVAEKCTAMQKLPMRTPQYLCFKTVHIRFLK